MAIDPKSSYYDAGGIESMAIAKAKLTEEQYQGAMLFNVLKYATRCNFKGSFERDVEKIKVYATLLDEAVNGEHVIDELPEMPRPTNHGEVLALCEALKAYRKEKERHDGTDHLQGVQKDTQA